MYSVYIIANDNSRLYIGITNSLKRRLREHNNGYHRSTKSYRPYRLVYHERFNTRPEARNREKYFKSGIGRKFLKEIVYRGVEK